MTIKINTRNHENNISATVIDAFDSLDLGEKMELIDDHDPRSIYNDMLKEHEGLFEWDYIQKGPDEWRVCIGKKYLSYI